MTGVLHGIAWGVFQRSASEGALDFRFTWHLQGFLARLSQRHDEEPRFDPVAQESMTMLSGGYIFQVRRTPCACGHPSL